MSTDEYNPAMVTICGVLKTFYPHPESGPEMDFRIVIRMSRRFLRPTWGIVLCEYDFAS
jgi:hypothetical protein